MDRKSWLYEFITSEAHRYKLAILAYERELKRRKDHKDAAIYTDRISKAKKELEEMYDVLEFMENR